MNRRRVLATLGGAVLGGLGGCVGGADPGAPSDGAPSNGSTDAAGTETPVDLLPPVDAEFPPGRDDVDEVVWYRQVSDPDDSLVLEPSVAAASLPRAELAFTLRNGTDRAFHTNFYDWALYRWEDGRWHHVAPQMVPQPLMTLPPGESHRWTLTADDGDRSAGSRWVEGTEDLTVSPLGGGAYAFAADGWWPDQGATPTYEHQTVRAAAFRLEADALELAPSDAVTDATRDGDVVTVSATNPVGGDADDRPGTYVLTRDDEAADPRELITEQVYRRWPLRDALAHAEPDVAEVRVETTTTSHPPFGVQDDEAPVAYEGRTYRVSATAEDAER